MKTNFIYITHIQNLLKMIFFYRDCMWIFSVGFVLKSFCEIQFSLHINECPLIYRSLQLIILKLCRSHFYFYDLRTTIVSEMVAFFRVMNPSPSRFYRLNISFHAIRDPYEDSLPRNRDIIAYIFVILMTYILMTYYIYYIYLLQQD